MAELKDRFRLGKSVPPPATTAIHRILHHPGGTLMTRTMLTVSLAALTLSAGVPAGSPEFEPATFSIDDAGARSDVPGRLEATSP